MPEYLPPCFNGECPVTDFSSDSSQKLCLGIAATIRGAGLVDFKDCPIKTLANLGPVQIDPHLAEVRSKLGIVAYYEATDLD